MNIILVHNHYQRPGGEDQVFAVEATLLENRGNSVVRYTVHNDEIPKLNKALVAVKAIWNTSEHRKIRELIKREHADIVHVHNTLPLISPAVYYAAKQEGVAVVQTLHNFRYTCPSALLYRNNRVCEDCFGKTVAVSGIIHACYRGSRLATSVVASMSAIHKIMGTYNNKVDVYIALTDFSQNKFVVAGLPKEKIFVKPNFFDSLAEVSKAKGGYALFVGRLVAEKGITTMLKAWGKKIQIPLRVFGDGPLRSEVKESVGEQITYYGHMAREIVLKTMKEANFVIFPSECYESFPLTIIEAFACGVPVIASRLGAMEEIIKDGKTGLHFNPSDADDLAAKIEWAWTHPKEMEEMGKNARREYELKYTADRNYQMLMDIYQRAIEHSKRKHNKSLTLR